MLTRVFKSGKVFDDSEFHQHNNVARELCALEGAFLRKF